MRDALVVGINVYQSLPSLKAPANDAEAIAQQLQTCGEFRVHRLPEVIQAEKPVVGQKTQVTLRELESALVNLFKPKGNYIPQTALFYFSGHGIQRDAGVREGYLALSDSQPEKGFYGLSLFWFRRLLQESPVRQRIVILDCCHSGELLNFLEADPGAHPGTDRLFMAASREYETAFESLDSPYSVFTKAILAGLNPSRIESGLITNHALTDYVNHALKGEIQQPLFESSGSEIVLTRRSGSRLNTPPIRSTDICPYRGLEFFDEAHAEYFFGREDLTEKLIRKLKAEQFVAVVGASGIGKSSLVRAGMIARLREEHLASGDDSWRIKLITPTVHPLKALASAFINPQATELERAEQLRRVEEFLKDGGVGLTQLIRASLPIESGISRLPEAECSRLLLVIDQFEEVFTLSRDSQAEQERQQFFDCLLGAMQLASDYFRVVVVLRSDFLSKCALYEGLAQAIEQHQLTVTPLKYEQIKATITRPARKVGLVCEPNLVYTMLLDISGAPGELPLLQYTLLELWQRRRISNEGGIARLTLEAYQELGGLRGTLQKRATDVFNSLSQLEQVVAKRIFLALTQLGEGTEDTRRRVTKSELVSPAYPEDLINQVLEKLVAAKLIITNQDVDVVHEALIRNWPLLRTWLNDSREILRRLRRIEQAAQEWGSAGRPSIGDFLLSGLRLRDAEDFLRNHCQELSAVAQQLIVVSRAESQRARRESRQLQIAVPTMLLATLAIVFSQYHNELKFQAERNQQLHRVTLRERAAIAQSILQDTDSDPTTGLLISRLAAEQGGDSFEAQSSLRSALQYLRLQLELKGHTGAVHHIAFSPDHRYLATAGEDGTIRLWTLNTQTIYRANLEPANILLWSTNSSSHSDGGTAVCQDSSCFQTDGAAADKISIAFSPQGHQLAAIAQDSPIIKIWSVDSGALERQITGSAPTTQLSFSPDGQWIATAHRDRSIHIWQASTGRRVAHLPQAEAIRSIQFNPNGQYLLSIGNSKIVQLWRLSPDSTRILNVEKALILSHSDTVNQATFNATGQQIATVCADGVARLWDTTGKLLQSFPSSPASTLSAASAPSPAMQVQFSPDEQMLAVITEDHSLALWDIRFGQLRKQLVTAAVVDNALSSPSDAHVAGVDLMSFSPSGHLVVTASSHETRSDGVYSAYVWDTETGDRVGVLSGHKGPIEAVQFSPDGTYVVTASVDGIVRLWAAEAGGELPTLTLPDVPIEWATFTQPNSETTLDRAANLVTIASSGKLQHWQILADPVVPSSPPPLPIAIPYPIDAQPSESSFWQRLLALLGRPYEGFTSVAVQTVATTSQANPAHPQAIALEPASPDPAVPMVREISLPLTPADPLKAKEPSLSSLAVSADGRLIATATPEGRLEILQIQANQANQARPSVERVHQIRNWRAGVNRHSMLSQVVSNAVRDDRSPPSDSTLSSLPENPLTEQPVAMDVAEVYGEPIALRQLLFSADNRFLLAIADDLTVRLWEVASGDLVQVFRGHEATVQQAQFSQDGQWVLTASWDRTVRIWRVDSGELVRTIAHPDSVSSASFSPDRQRILTGSWDGVARVFDANTGEELLSLNGHQQAILDAKFSFNGQLIATASSDGTAYLWDAQTGLAQAKLDPARPNVNPQPILRLSFSPDDQYIATLTKDGKVHLWAATWNTLLDLARDRSLRQLTPAECSRYLKLDATNCPVLDVGG